MNDFPPILPSVDADENDVDDRTLVAGKGPVEADVGVQQTFGCPRLQPG